MPAHLPLHRTARANPLIPYFPNTRQLNMTSTVSDAGQQELLRSLALPASQADATSLCDEEVLSATGESRDTAICISNDETDIEDKGDDKGQDFDDSQSCTTPTTSIADHFGPLADPEPNQQSPYQTDRMSAGDAAACTDASFDVSPTSPRSQPHRSVSDEQQLVTGATSEPDIMMVDALSDEHKDTDVDTEGSGSEDDLDIPECHCHKRRKPSRSPHSSVRSTPTSARDSRRRKRSTRAVAHSLRERDTSTLGLLTPTPSHARSVPSDATALLQFEE
ncbi:Uncharacterized protein TCAP_02568 [Tolypocladium capitatum]|uniref:Uncharacterized protein n=1 Tax=Tolypocladium capitatum TaxID=45235 RepID=A0A2K3QIY2_9HYPO|nr:Uncharacterized protein TCAP_02568 [Tolypocladium capitatum]